MHIAATLNPYAKVGQRDLSSLSHYSPATPVPASTLSESMER